MQKFTQMLMQPNWEEYLTPAPLSIAIMGELIFISSSTDFSINKNPPKGGYKYIKYPDSFRACLMQICNSGYQTFNMAHKNMDQIRLHTAAVPGYTKAVVKILFQGNEEIVEEMLPIKLESIRSIADDCVKLADGVEKKYSDMINLIQELLEACVDAKHVYGEDLENVEKKIMENKMRQESAKEMNERSKKAMETMSRQLVCNMPMFREQLKQTREKAVENMEKNQKELTDCDIKKIDYETTVKMLVKGLDAMGSVKEQWEKMVCFFQMVTNIVKISLNKTLLDFVKTSEVKKKLSYSSDMFNKEMFNQAFQFSNITNLVNMISGTYCEVSNQYLMDRVSSLGKLMAMDKNKPEFLEERLKVQKSCKEAQEGILQLVLKNKKEFEKKTDARVAQIEEGLKAILPAAPPEETKRVKENVQAGFEDY